MQFMIVSIVYTFFAVIAQSLIFYDFPTQRVWIDLLFYLIVIFGIRFHTVVALSAAAIIGFIYDSVSYAPLGTAMVPYILVVIFIRKVKKNIFIENRFSFIFWLLVFSFLRQIFEMIVLSLYSRPSNIALGFYIGIPFKMIVDATVGVIIISILEKFIETDYSRVFQKKGLGY